MPNRYEWIYLALCAATAAVVLRDLARTDRSRPLLALRRDAAGAAVMAFIVTAAVLPIGLLVAPALHPELSLSGFTLIRLWAWGVFVVMPAALLGTAALNGRGRGPRVLTALELSLAAGVLAIGVDAFLVEPTWLEVSHHTLRSSALTRSYTIAVLADLQTEAPGEHERAALEAAAAAQPDLVLLPGDYVQAPPERRAAAEQALRELLLDVGLSAPLGIYATEGNVENSRSDDWTAQFAGTGVTALTERTTLELTHELVLTALPLAESADPSLSLPPQDRFHLVTGHIPDFALGQHHADLLVAGHTHGGQVRLPLIGPLMTLSSVPRAWAAGVTALPGGGTLAVSRGVGMERGQAPRLRFRCRPEVMILHLEPEGQP